MKEIGLQVRKTMWRKATSASPKKPQLNKPLIFIIITTFLLPLLLTSCAIYDVFKREPEGSGNGTGTGEGKLYDEGLFLFDPGKIKLDITSAIGMEIKNCNISTDIYEDLIILGEAENISEVNKKDIRFTFDFYDEKDEAIISGDTPALVNYLGAGSRLPFYYYMDEKDRFIEIYRIRVGVDYKDYNRSFDGNPVVEEERRYFTGDGKYMVVEGRIINIGEVRIKNIEVFSTFYNDREQVVFIRKCYTLRKEMIPGEEQKFKLELMLDEYLPEFTHYRFGVFFEDEVKTGA